MPDAGSMETLCTSCKSISCCTDFMPPLLSPDELKLIIEKTGMKNIADSHTINGMDVFSVKPKENIQECMFFSSEKQCTIYDHRPFDCKIYPFDIYKIDDEYRWIVYSCNPDSDRKWSEELLDKFEKELLTPNMVEYLVAFSSLERFDDTKQITYEYAVLRKVDFTKYSNTLDIK